MWIFLATILNTFMSPSAGSASLARRGRGWEDCWPHAHLGTCWENFAHAAKCPVALRAPFYILNYLEIQPHGPSACLDPCSMAAGIRNLLCSQSPQVPSSPCPKSMRGTRIYVCTCADTYVWLGLCMYVCIYVCMRGMWRGCMLSSETFSWLLMMMLGECFQLLQGNRNDPISMWGSTEIVW